MNTKSSQHPLQDQLSNFKCNKEEQNIKLASKTFGIGFALHLKHERYVSRLSGIGHLPFMKRHNTMYESLTGQDVEFDFDDVLALEPEFVISTTKTMDNWKTGNI